VSPFRTTQSRPHLAYECSGAEGENVVLIQGLGMGRRGWDAQVPMLSRHHRVLAFDPRDIGDSEKVSRGYSIATLAHDVLRLADEVGWARFHVVGLSMGGLVAQEVALLAPQRVKSLALIASHAGGVTAPVPTWRALWPLCHLAVKRKTGRNEALSRLLLSPEFLKQASPPSVHRRMSLTAQEPPFVLWRQVSAVFRHDVRTRLASLSLPTLIVKPGKDALCRPAHSDTLKALLPHAQVLEFPGSGHAVIFEHAEAVNELLLAHLTSAAT
jgi:pimeloyl-ACP methyl ester carboxylesterase